jgi:hypothetical protein
MPGQVSVSITCQLCPYTTAGKLRPQDEHLQHGTICPRPRREDSRRAPERSPVPQNRERIANLLTWYLNRDLLGSEGRQHERFEPRIAAQKLILPNGDVHNCRVIDVSLSGASIATRVKPPVDSVVVLGRLRGR